jgi:hypothetical protein
MPTRVIRREPVEMRCSEAPDTADFAMNDYWLTPVGRAVRRRRHDEMALAFVA